MRRAAPKAPSASQAGLASTAPGAAAARNRAMNPTSLVNLSPEALREHARHGMSACPAAGPVERTWAAAACFVLLALAVLLIVGLR
jgi:hypothetical protein